MWHTVSSAWKVAGHEFADSIRSRRAVVLLVIYLIGSMAATALFVRVLREIDNQIGAVVRLPDPDLRRNAGALLSRSQAVRQIAAGLCGDEALARELLGIPPLALFYGWLSMACAPLLVVLLSSSRVAEEVASGAARFVLFRVSRLAWCIGKFAGQATQLLLALLLGAAGAWAIGSTMLAGSDPGSAALALFVHALKVWVYALAFLGLATGVSQTVANPHLATGLGVGAYLGISILGGMAGRHADAGGNVFWGLAHALTPSAYATGLWRSDPGHLVPALCCLLLLALAYLLAGHVAFARRDM